MRLNWKEEWQGLSLEEARGEFVEEKTHIVEIPGYTEICDSLICGSCKDLGVLFNELEVECCEECHKASMGNLVVLTGHRAYIVCCNLCSFLTQSKNIPSIAEALHTVAEPEVKKKEVLVPEDENTVLPTIGDSQVSDAVSSGKGSR